jgi:ubiquinone/menaquinone biosynthesis C-methylase UbiE
VTGTLAVTLRERAVNRLRRTFDALEERRAVSIASALRPYLHAGETVLDLGCGSLIVADQIRKALRVQVMGLDMIDFRKRPLPMVLCSGSATPFKDRSFDAVIIGFVLHHCDDGGLAVLREAQRVARKRILLLEDSYDHRTERFVTRVVDKLLNWLEDPRIPVPYRFRSSEDWTTLFSTFGMTLSVMERIRTTPLLNTRQILFVLKP